MAKRGLEYIESAERRLLLDTPFAAGALSVLGLASGPLALATSIDTKSAPLFRQRRLWQPGTPLPVLKWRTMPPDPPNAPLQLKGTHDDRASRFGNWLRRIGLDELPQVVNVISGTMSAVGPRPRTPKSLEMMEQSDGNLFADWLPLYQRIRPGLYGPSQVWRRGMSNNIGPEAHRASMKMDIRYYTEDACLTRDWALIIRTSEYLAGLGGMSAEEIVASVSDSLGQEVQNTTLGG